MGAGGLTRGASKAAASERGAPEAGPREGGRFTALDGVRGLAALMVALSHYTLAFQPALLGGAGMSHFAGDSAISRTAAIVVFNPELGVAIFFVLSGFVLASSVAAKPASFAELAARRWVRLSVPILGTSLLIWPLVQWHLFRSVEAAPLARSSWLAMNYAWMAFEANDPVRLVWQSCVDIFARSRAMYNTALWTMPIEFWGSMVLFAIYRVVPRTMARPGVGLAVALAMLALVWRTNYFGFPCGVALFEARRLWLGVSPSRRAGAVLLAGPLGTGLLTFGVLLGGHPYSIDLAAHGAYARLFIAMSAWVANPVLLAHRLGAVAIVAAALVWPPMRRAMSRRPLQWLGRVSFMVYLCHVPIICSLVAGGLLWLEPVVGYNAACALLLPVFLAVLALVAEATTQVFDGSAIRASRMAGSAVGRAVARAIDWLPAGRRLAQLQW